jgi:hypothetical protein
MGGGGAQHYALATLLPGVNFPGGWEGLRASLGRCGVDKISFLARI